jgi:hypothetical protein
MKYHDPGIGLIDLPFKNPGLFTAILANECYFSVRQ